MVGFKKAINNNVMGFTNNGAVTLKSSGDPNLDLFFLIGAARGKDIREQLQNSHNVNPELTASIALWARDIRGGAGERGLFRQYLQWIATYAPHMASRIINSGKVQEVGRWDDYLVFADNGISELWELACRQIARGLSEPNTVGLVAKWMPRQGKIAKKLADYFHLSARNWRKNLVRSTNVVEQLMCAKEWEKINYSQVPSVASARYQKAFGRHSPELYDAYKASLVKNDGSVKINASTVYPYDIIKSSKYGDVTVAQAQWDALPNFLTEGQGILPLLDVSGSMGALVPGTQISMMDVCVSIGLYIALRQTGEFNRVIMNFSERSEIINLKKKSLPELYREATGMNWGGNTNIHAAFQNLLKFGKMNGVSDTEMPKIILIISDMEFDSCGSRYMTNMEAIERDYKNAGYTIPQIVFWCLNGRPGNVPVKHNKDGVALVSGFSPSIMKSILSGKNFNPRDIMLNTVNVPKYQLTSE